MHRKQPISITAGIQGSTGIAIGNILGSNILNIFIILGVTSIITTVAIQKSTLKIEIPYMIFISILFVVMGMSGNKISRIEGVILWVFFIIYLVYLFILAKNGKEENKKVETSTIKLLLSAIVGAVIVVLGSNVTVDSATAIAKAFGMTDRFIGLTIVALGTSLPELVTSVTAARKGNADIAIGNVVGSNLFNILFVLGTSSLIIPIDYKSNFLIDGIVAIAACIILWIAVFRKLELRRVWGIVMVTCYAGYFIYLL